METVPREVAWFVSFVLVEAAVIDGRSLRVPNWLTFHFALGGLIYGFWTGGTHSLVTALAGTAVGLLTLLPLYSIGGMGAGDVKLMAGVGAWIGPWFTVWAFASSALVGSVMAVAMIVYSGQIYRHLGMIHLIGLEVVTLRNPAVLAERAAGRKPNMMLLPYGIPIAVGTIAYFAVARFLA
jgi:prepilin peptidase CpaA